MRSIKLLLITIAVITSQLSFSQREYLVKVDPITGAHTFIDSVPGVVFISTGNATIDENNGRFIFIGTDANFNASLYSIDLNSGTTVSNPSFPVGLTQFDNISSLIFNNIDSTLYGLMYLDANQTYYLVSVNPVSGIHSIIDSISGFQYIIDDTQTIDEVNNTYSFIATDISGMASNLFSFDLSSGNLLSNPTSPNTNDFLDGIFNIKQDTLSSLIGIFDDYSSSTLSLVNINRTTGLHTVIDTLNDFVNYIPFQSVYHQSSKIYSFTALDQQSDSRFYSYNANNGTLLSSPLFPILPDTNDNISELEIDNSTGMIYGLYWDNDITVGLKETENESNISLFPNPAEGILTIRLENELIHEVTIFNNNGQLVAKQNGHNQEELLLDTDRLRSGVYFMRIKSNKTLLTEKVMIK